jgi:branched-chain amino acid transport system permease protein
MLTGFIASRWVALTIISLALLVIVPLFAPTYYVYILALIFVTALLAMSLNFVLGYGGIYQFHHAVFYGVGAYTAAIIITRFKQDAWLAFLVGPFVAALTGLIIGWFCVRLTRLYFGMLQISLGSLIWIVVLRWYNFTGGDNGISDIPIPPALKSETSAYYFTFALVAICVSILYLIVKSPFGATLQAIRDNAPRCEAIGIDVRRHQLIAIVIAAFFGGVAGVLFVALERSVFPGMLFWSFSLELFIMCLLGGWFTFAGPMIGAAAIIALSRFAGRNEYWTTLLGVILILLIFFLPEGVMGFIQARFNPLKEEHVTR